MMLLKTRRTKRSSKRSRTSEIWKGIFGEIAFFHHGGHRGMLRRAVDDCKLVARRKVLIGEGAL